MCANAHNHQSTLLNYLFGSGVILNMSWFSTKLVAVNCASGLFNLSILDQSVSFRSFVLEIIIPLLSKHQIIQMFYNPMPSQCFFLWLCADAHISSLWTVGSFVEISSDSVFRIQKPREVLSLIHNAFGKLYPLILSPMLYYQACIIYY